MQKLHVLMRKEELDPERVAGKVVVVLDVLFATSTIVSALAHGARAVIPARDPEDARASAAGLEDGSYLLAGERHLEAIPGFATYAPLALAREALKDRLLIYSTTNGTVALGRTAGARAVYAAALLNGPAVAAHIAAHHHEETVLLVCAGADGAFNIEDFLGAGCLCDYLLRSAAQRWQPSDAAVTAAAFFRGEASQLRLRLLESRLGRRVAGLGQAEEVAYAAETGVLDVVPRLRNGCLQAAG